MMDDQAPDRLVVLLSVMGHAVHEGPGLSFPIAVARPAGTRAVYDVLPVIGEAINGDNAWYRMVTPSQGFVHGSYLREVPA